MSSVTPYHFEGASIRVVDIDGVPWFVAKDATDALGYANSSDAVTTHCKGVAKRYPLQTAGGRQEARILSESDLFRLIVNSALPAAERFERWVFEEVLPSIRKTGSYSMPKAAQSVEASGLPEFRRARALDLAAKTAERIVAQFPSLSEDSRRVVFAKVINPVAGTNVLSLPRVEQKHYQAGEVGDILGISGTMVGRIANQHGLKTEQHGYFRLDKSAHSSKQVETFVYNDKGVEAIRGFVPQPGSGAARRASAKRELETV